VTGFTIPYTDTAVVGGTTYYYKVTAVVAGTETSQSSEVSATDFSPASLSPSFWLKADGTLRQTVSGTPATADNDPVGEWVDVGSFAANPSGATTKRPLLKLNIKNSLPVIRFDGVDDQLVTPVGGQAWWPSKRGTWFGCFCNRKASGYGALFGNYSLDSWMVYSAVSSTTFKWFTSGGTDAHAAAVDTKDSFFIQSLTRDGDTSMKYFVNAGTVQNFAQDNAQPGVVKAFLGTNSISTEPLQVDWCELLFFPTALSDANRQLVRDYLNKRWAVY
jgi:hypothetical protein